MVSNRAALEVLKWCSASDLLLHLCCVSAFYARLCNQDEVWFELLGPTHSSLPSTSAKLQYRQAASLYLPVVTEDQLCKFYVHSHTWQVVQLSHAVGVNRYVSVVLTIDRLVFATGGFLEQDTFSISPNSGTVTFLEPLRSHRQSMGVIRYQENIYTFGGFKSSSYSNESEVYMYAEQHWRPLPDSLVARSSLSPAQHQGKIYLLGGCGTIKCEYFDTVSETFHMLPMHLPDQYCTVAICTSSELFAVQKVGYYCYEFEKPVNSWEMTPFPFNFGPSFWCDCPVVCMNGAYYIHLRGTCRIIALNLTAKTFSEFSDQTSTKKT